MNAKVQLILTSLPTAKRAKRGDNGNGDLDFSQGLNELVSHHEAHILKKTLQKFQGGIDSAAGLLKISRPKFYKKLKDYNIEIK